jgi:alanine dehydrogenase
MIKENQEIRDIVLMSETFDGERRTLLTPDNAKKLIDSGANVYVEKSNIRVFHDYEYEAVGCKLVEQGYWKTQDAEDAIILGVKYLPQAENVEEYGISNRTIIHWAHAFDGDPDYAVILARYQETSMQIDEKDLVSHLPSLLDLEVLKNDDNQYLFNGKNAGIAGAACSLIAWAKKHGHIAENAYDNFFGEPYDTKEDVAKHLKEVFDNIPNDKKPKIGIIGARGNAGSGAAWLLDQVGLGYDSYNRDETSQVDFTDKLLQQNIVINCVAYKTDQPEKYEFLNDNILEQNPNTSLEFISDVSADPTLGILQFNKYKLPASWSNPFVNVGNSDNPVQIIAIDNMPNLFAKEASYGLSNALIDDIIALSKTPLDFEIQLPQRFIEPNAIMQGHLDFTFEIKELAHSIALHSENTYDADEYFKEWLQHRGFELKSYELAVIPALFKSTFEYGEYDGKDDLIKWADSLNMDELIETSPPKSSYKSNAKLQGGWNIV